MLHLTGFFYKKHGAFTLHFVAFVLSLVSCSGMGILTLFSIFAKYLDSVLGLSQGEINTIIVIQVFGMNMCTPLSGYIADARGIWILPLIAMAGYLVSFGVLFASLEVALSKYWIYFAFFIMGGTHVTFLFSSLLNSAKSFGRYYTTLAISSPNLVTAFSSFIQIQIIQKYLSNGDNTEVENFRSILKFFFVAVMSTTFTSLIACKLTDHVNFLIQQDELDEESCINGSIADDDAFESFETSPLLTGGATVLTSSEMALLGSPRSWYMSDVNSNIDEELSLDPLAAPEQEVSNYHKKVKSFLKDPFMYILMTCCLVSMSSSEFFIANLNSILINLQKGKELDKSLEVFSITATITRFSIMMFTDFVCSRVRISRISIYTSVVVLAGLSYIYLSTTPIMEVDTHIIIIGNSILNSTVFTLFPAILASIYGMDILGTTWGIFCSSSAIGNIGFNTLYTMDYGSNCINIQNTLSICSTLTFVIFGVLLVASGVSVYICKQVYIRKSGQFF